MPFEIDTVEPPAGARPKGNGFQFLLPESTGNDGQGNPVGAVGKPRIRIAFERIDETGWDWWAALTGDSLSAILSSVQFYNPFKSGGAGFETWTGGGIIHRPTYEAISTALYLGVEIMITELEKS